MSSDVILRVQIVTNYDSLALLVGHYHNEFRSGMFRIVRATIAV